MGKDSPYAPIVTVTPVQIVADQNDYAPDAAAPARDSLFLLFSDAARTITGIAFGVQSRRRFIVNTGAFPITLSNEGGASAAENRVITGLGVDLTLGVNQMILLLYDPVNLRWRVTAVGGGFGMSPETVEFFPEPETRVTGNATRVAQTVFNGASYKIFRPVTFSRILIRVTAFTAPGTIRVLFYQKAQGLGANATLASLVASVTGFSPGATGNFLLTPAEGRVTLAAGVYYVLFGRDSAAGSVTLRTFTVLTLDLSNANVDAATHVTSFTTAIAATTSPLTFDPRPVATGQATPSVIDVALTHRLINA